MVRFIAGLWVEGRPEGQMSSTSGAPVAAHVGLHAVLQKDAITAMSPDDADRLADELRAAAAVARGGEDTAS